MQLIISSKHDSKPKYTWLQGDGDDVQGSETVRAPEINLVDLVASCNHCWFKPGACQSIGTVWLSYIARHGPSSSLLQESLVLSQTHSSHQSSSFSTRTSQVYFGLLSCLDEMISCIFKISAGELLRSHNPVRIVKAVSCRRCLVCFLRRH